MVISVLVLRIPVVRGGDLLSKGVSGSGNLNITTGEFTDDTVDRTYIQLPQRGITFMSVKSLLLQSSCVKSLLNFRNPVSN